MHSLGIQLCMSLLFLEPAPHMYTYAFLHYAGWVFYVSGLILFDLFVHVAPAGAPAWAMRLCQGIHVNFLPPSKVVVYAAQAAAPPVLTYMRAPIEVLDSFTYLGADISSRSAFAAASIGRAASAQRVALALQHRCHDLSLHDPALQLHLFDALVRPVMLYGVETWGPGALWGSGMDSCELVQRKFLRSILGVRTGTPNVAVLEGKEGNLHVCPDKASWPMQGLQRERHAQTN
jgi:hypothetical protein